MKKAQRKVTRGKDIGAEMIRSMREAIAFERGEGVGATFRAAPITARQASVIPAPDFEPYEIVQLRESFGYSQAIFAQALNVSPETEKAWEQGKAPPSGASKRLLQMVRENPVILDRFVQVSAGTKGPRNGAPTAERGASNNRRAAGSASPKRK